LKTHLRLLELINLLQRVYWGFPHDPAGVSMPSLSQTLLADLQARIKGTKLDDVADLIIGNAAECYSMEVAGADDYSVLGNTRFGGDPDLPNSFPWPCDGDPKSPGSTFSNFIAQVNFSELPPLCAGPAVPKKGILYLFVRSMDGASNPVLLQALYFDGPTLKLRRTPPPDEDRLCDEYLVDLAPQRIKATPSVSLPFYQKEFRTTVEKNGNNPWYELASGLERKGQIGQMLGYANAGDIRENLYRQVFLGRIDRRSLMYNDYWNSMEEYEAYIRSYRDRGDNALVKSYELMRAGVTWLVDNRDMISRGAAEWRLLLRIDSNSQMNLNINDADPLYVFIREKDLAKGEFSDLAGEVTQG